MKLKYIVNDLNKYSNLKEILKAEFIISDRLLVRLKNLKQIFINNEPTFINRKLNINDIITVDLDYKEESSNIIPVKMDLDILFEDDAILAINKPPFIPVHPSMDHYNDSLSNGIKFYFDSLGLYRKIRPINRLDKNTSGIVLFAKNAYIQECLIRQMNSGIFEKEYLAIVEGFIEKKELVIDAGISRKENSIIERCINSNGDKAITIINSINFFTDFSLIKCTLKTGRTHQIRVHTKYINHPILGDTLYGNSSNLINRQALHAYKVCFIHPISKEKVEIKCDLPNDMQKLLQVSN